MKRAGALLVALAACNTGSAATPPKEPPDAPVPDFASGTRLRAVVVEVDGIRVFDHFFDRVRNEPCAFIEAGTAHSGPNAAYWCLPIGALVSDAADSATALFVDQSCTQLLAVAPSPGGATYALVQPVNACTTPPAIHHLGAPSKTHAWHLSGGRCVEMINTVVATPLTDEVPLDAFVRADVAPAPSENGRIAPLVLTTADGAKQTIGGYDRARSAPAQVSDPGSTGDPRWFPSQVAFTGANTPVYGDNACGVELPTKIGSDAVCPIGAAFAFVDQCGNGSFYEIGPAPAALYEKTPTTCATAAPTDLAALLVSTLGAPIARTSFAPALTAERGTSAVRVRGWSDGVTTPMWNQLVDTNHDAACAPVTAADGKMRCLPITLGTVNGFADSACTEPALELSSSGCKTVLPVLITDAGHVFALAGASTTSVFAQTAAGCTKQALPAGLIAYPVDEVDISTFPLVTQRQL